MCLTCLVDSIQRLIVHTGLCQRSVSSGLMLQLTASRPSRGAYADTAAVSRLFIAFRRSSWQPRVLWHQLPAWLLLPCVPMHGPLPRVMSGAYSLYHLVALCASRCKDSELLLLWGCKGGDCHNGMHKPKGQGLHQP